MSPRTIWTHFDITMTSRTTLRTTFGRKTEFLSWTLIPRFECPVFGFFRIVTTRVVRGRWYRSKMVLWMLLYCSGGGSTTVVIIECSNSPWSKCWRNRWIPLRTESDLRSDNDILIMLSIKQWSRWFFGRGMSVLAVPCVTVNVGFNNLQTATLDI